MEHRQATEEVIRLLPQMEGRDPAEVLVKTATQRNWSPAILHKVAQVYNTCSTLHAQRVDRNSIPQLVDAPEVVRRFVGSAGRSMHKAASSFMHDPQLASPLDKAASAQGEGYDEEVPYAWAEAPKRASAAPHVVDASVVRRWKIEDFKTAAHRVLDDVNTVVDARSAHVAALTSVTSRIKAASFRDGADVMAKIEQDARSLGDPDVVSHAFDLIGDFAKRAGMAVYRFDPSRHEDHIIGRDRSGLAGIADMVHGTFSKLASSVTDLSEHMENLLKLATDLPEGYGRRAEGLINRVCSEAEAVQAFFKLAATSAPQDSDVGDERSPTRRQPIGGFERTLLDAEKALERGAEQTTPGVLLDDGESSAASFATAVAGVPIAVSKAVANKAIDVASAPLNLVGKVAPGGALDSALSGVGAKDRSDASTRQKSLDLSGDDVLARANLQRLMITDDIISVADPLAVVENFNAIRNSSPEVALSSPLLKLQLRAALQHQGYDIDSATASRKYENEGRKRQTEPSNLA